MVNLKEKYPPNTPYDKESFYYRKIFDKYYPNQEKIVPYIWKQSFSDNIDPSSRLLECYHDDELTINMDFSNNVYSNLI